MRSRTRRSIKRSLCGLLAVLMSLHGIAVAGGVFAQAAPASEVAPVVATANAGTMPCADMMAVELMVDVPPQTAESVPSEDCDGDCCDQGHGCSMVFCLVGSCLPATLCATHGFPNALVVAGEFPPPALGTIASAQGPPLRPPIA